MSFGYLRETVPTPIPEKKREGGVRQHVGCHWARVSRDLYIRRRGRLRVRLFRTERAHKVWRPTRGQHFSTCAYSEVVFVLSIIFLTERTFFSYLRVTQEYRENLVKTAKATCEQAKQSLRKIRQKGMSDVKKNKTGRSEDDVKSVEKMVV